MDHHRMTVYQDDSGEWRWHLAVGSEVVATSCEGEGFKNEADCLHSLFGIFFGTWDESFLANYGKWMKYSGEKVPYDLPPESTEGIPVRIADTDAPDYAKAEDVVPQVSDPNDQVAMGPKDYG
jgi:uncharacterized protein YegP (UPF0339 family)